jgi:hypothetical protein
MRHPKVFRRIPLSLLACLALFGCRSKGGAPSEAGSAAVAPVPGGPESTPVEEELPAVAGIWNDEIGDAPWRSIVLTAIDEKHGTYVGRNDCTAPPCAPVVEGEFSLDGRRLTLNPVGRDSESFEVHIGGDIMEWRQDDVMLRRLRRIPPPRPMLPDPTAGPYPPPCAKPAPGTPCEKMTAAGCLWSAECVLEALGRDAPGAPYRCRPAVPPCEGGVAQGDDGFEADCRARRGCTFRPSECYCPSARTEVVPALDSDEYLAVGGINCTCGGGPYRRCLPETPDSADASPDT